MLSAVLALLLSPAAAAPSAAPPETVPIPGTPLTALVRKPAGAEGRLPALMIFGGFEAGARALDAVAPKTPVLLATFEYPGPRRVRFPGVLLEGRRLKRALRETERGMLSLGAALRAREDVDPSRVCVVGVSFAAPLALRAAAEDPGLSCVVIVEGFADVKGTAKARLRQQMPKLGPLARPLAWLAAGLGLAYLRPPRPERDAAALRAPQRVLLVEAAEDDMIPERSRALLREALARSGARVDRVSMPGSHLRGAADPRIPAIVEAAERWLAGETPHIPL